MADGSRDDHPFPPPPKEAYGRLTNPERFEPLHHFAAELLDRLEATYEVQRELVSESEYPEWHKIEFVKPVVRLRPLDPTEAPLVVGFSAFPGLFLRFAEAYREWFPVCGCDACGGTAESEWETVQHHVDALVGGGFTESIRIRRVGRSSVFHRFESQTGISSNERLVSREEAVALAGSGGAERTWRPWTPRAGNVGPSPG